MSNIDMTVYQPIIINALCKSLCPTIDQTYINKESIIKDMGFHMDMYVKTLLEAQPDEELYKKIEDIMLTKLGNKRLIKDGNKIENKMYESRYRIQERYKMDKDPETLGKPTAPFNIWFTAYEFKVDPNEGGYEKHDKHPVRLWTGMGYPPNSTCSDLIKKIKENDYIHDTDRDFKVYFLGSNSEKKSYSTDELFDLYYTTNQIHDYNTKLDQNGIIVYGADTGNKKQKTEK